MNLPVFWRPDKGSWYFGFWCSGPESLPGDGLLCYRNLEGRSESVRENDLVEASGNPLSALLKWLKNRLFN